MVKVAATITGAAVPLKAADGQATAPVGWWVMRADGGRDRPNSPPIPTD